LKEKGEELLNDSIKNKTRMNRIVFKGEIAKNPR